MANATASIEMAATAATAVAAVLVLLLIRSCPNSIHARPPRIRWNLIALFILSPFIWHYHSRNKPCCESPAPILLHVIGFRRGIRSGPFRCLKLSATHTSDKSSRKLQKEAINFFCGRIRQVWRVSDTMIARQVAYGFAV